MAIAGGFASEQGITLKAHMHDNPTSVRLCCARIYSGRRGLCSGFSICLFVMVLSVCGWVMHRRLSQYDAPQQAVHQSTAIKAYVTKRNPISVPSMHGTEAFAAFLPALAFAAVLSRPGTAEASLAFRVRRDQHDRRADAGSRSSLDYFFFLPPPTRSSVS
ncbi:MAG TPA: hypothetical protein VE218_12305 [Acidobacteriaceae bacterium]|nr:hypothetical protein [Acidobacteriaceae bacterium]